MSKIIILCIAFAFAFSVNAADNKKCDQLVKQAEVGLKNLLFSSNTTFPHTREEYAAYGHIALKGYGIMKEYRACNRGFARQVYNMVFKGVSKTLREMYGKNANVTKILHQIRCFDDNLRPKFQNCINNLANNIKYVSVSVPDNQMFPGSCCSAQLGLNCIYNEINNHCNDGREEGLKFVHFLVNSLLGDLFEFACADHSTVEVCEKKVPQIVEKLRSDGNQSKKSDEFLLRPLLAIAKKRISSE